MSEFKPGEAVDVYITGARVHQAFREGSAEDGVNVVQVLIPGSQYYTVVPLGDLYLYREIYRTRRLVEDHARDVLARGRARQLNDCAAELRAALEES